MLWTIIVISLFFLFYVYIGYPYILYILAKRKDKFIPKVSYTGDISILMVVCNEEKNIERKLNNLLDLNYSGGNLHIVVVDDASDDMTLDIIHSYGDKVKLLSLPKRSGKASGINHAMKYINTELTMMVDCRQKLEIDVVNLLSSWFSSDDKVGAVSGELMFLKEGSNEFSQGMDGYWKYEKLIRSSEAVIASVPGVTGALYMLRTSAYQSIEPDTLLDDVLIPMNVIKQGLSVGFDSRAIAWDIPSTSVQSERRRKIRTLSGNYQLLLRSPQWVLPFGHPIWWQFFSHKIARLIAPFAGLASLLAGLVLGLGGDKVALLYSVTFISTLMLVPLTLLVPRMNRVSIIKLITSFITLNWFCVLAFFHYVSGIKSGSWKS